MTSELILLRNQRVVGLQQVRVLKRHGILEWLGEWHYKPLSPISQGKFTISFSDRISFASAVAGDLIRLSNASFETMSNIKAHPVFPKSLGWALIQAYYASFFAAHAFMRAHRCGVIRLEVGHLRILSEAVAVADLPNDNSLGAGNYFMEVDCENNSIQFSQMGSSPHESLWRCFLPFSSLISERIGNGAGLTKDKEKLIYLFSELHQTVQLGLPSQIRNRLNYRHDYGVWYPFTSFKSAAHSETLRILSRWNESPVTLADGCRQKEETKRLASMATCLVSLIRETMLDLESMTNVGKAFSGRKTTAFISRLLT